MALPNSFVNLDTAYKRPSDTLVNIIGTVVDIMPPIVTKIGQHMLTFKLLDRSLYNSIYGSEGLRVRFFRADAKNLPQIQSIGDVVLIRNIKMSSYQEQPLALSTWTTETTVFPTASIPEVNFEVAYQGSHRLERLGVPLDVQKLSLEEQSYVVHLKHEMSDILPSFLLRAKSAPNAGHTAVPPGAPTEPAAMRKRSAQDLSVPDPKKQKYDKKRKSIKELNHYDFADIYAQVVKKFPTNMGSCDLYVTDYTENKQMFLYDAPEDEDERGREGDTFGYTGAPKRSWPGPYGQLVLKIELRDPHAYYANRQVQEGDFVLLKNVRIKVFKHLEGSMWPDARNPEEVKISRIKTSMNLEQPPEVVEIRERKESYWAAREAKISKSAQPEKKKPTETEKKKLKRAEKAAAAEKKAKLNAGGQETALQTAMVNGHTKANVNQHVRCSHEHVPISSIKMIRDVANDIHTTAKPDRSTYELPFVNVKRRAQVRVVDYEPRQLEDFAVAEGLDDEKSDDSHIDYESSLKHEWFFSLQLEDACQPKAAHTDDDRIWVNVSHTDAQYLFGNAMDDPRDLRNDSRLLSKMKEKLCILWGNLEEKSQGEQLSNRPFECCLAEYGVAMDEDDPDRDQHPFGFKKMYRMFGVTIL